MQMNQGESCDPVGKEGSLGPAPRLLAKSPEQNPCGKICSQHGAKLDENRTSTLTNSTTVQSIGSVCRLVVISPTVSSGFTYPPDRPQGWSVLHVSGL